MQYQIQLSPSAVKELSRLPQNIQSRLSEKIADLSIHPRPSGTKALQGQKGILRLRVGDYRILYQVDDPTLRIRILKIAHRRDVYRDF